MVYRSFIPNKTTFTRYCLTQWISNLRKSFEIHWVRQYLVNFTGLVSIVYVTVYSTETVFTGLKHGKLSQFYALRYHKTVPYPMVKTAFTAILKRGPEHGSCYYDDRIGISDGVVISHYCAPSRCWCPLVLIMICVFWDRTFCYLALRTTIRYIYFQCNGSC